VEYNGDVTWLFFVFFVVFILACVLDSGPLAGNTPKDMSVFVGSGSGQQRMSLGGGGLPVKTTVAFFFCKPLG
jgi:hypothetical protein